MVTMGEFILHLLMLLNGQAENVYFLIFQMNQGDEPHKIDILTGNIPLLSLTVK